ncbi:MAG: ribosome silencing factor [Oscillospiraceae bacterium]|jgi:ribosome-associated protein|nr:ribosome silencing factor [Oscillospiraceae bacterium]
MSTREPLELAQDIVTILDKKLAKDIKLIKISDLTVLADYFVIATGTNSTQVKALAAEVEFKLKQEGVTPKNVEGKHPGGWIILDYYSVIVHVFYSETREFYDLEKLWIDGETLDISNLLVEE